MPIEDCSLIQDWYSLVHWFSCSMIVSWWDIVFFLFVIGSSSIQWGELLSGGFRNWKSFLFCARELFHFIHFIKGITLLRQTAIFGILSSPIISKILVIELIVLFGARVWCLICGETRYLSWVWLISMHHSLRHHSFSSNSKRTSSECIYLRLFKYCSTHDSFFITHCHGSRGRFDKKLFRAYRWTFIDPAQWGGIFLHFIYLIIFLSTCFWFYNINNGKRNQYSTRSWNSITIFTSWVAIAVGWFDIANGWSSIKCWKWLK